MRIFSIVLVLAIALCTFFGCSDRGVIKDTSSETETQSSTMNQQTGGNGSTSENDSMTQSNNQSDPLTDSESESESESGSQNAGQNGSQSGGQGGGQNETGTEDSLFSDFFGKTREEIMNARGEGDTTSENDNSLHYTDRYAGFSGSSRYSFDEEGNLGDITLSFDEGFTLDEIAEAVTKLNAEAVTQNGVTTWTEGDYVYRLAEEEGHPVLQIQKGGTNSNQSSGGQSGSN